MRTCLHPADSMLAGLSARQLTTPWLWPQQTPIRGVGGSLAYYQAPAIIALWHEDRREWQMLSLTLDIAPLRAETQGLPSLLGWDVLQHFRLERHWRSGRVELHDG